MGGAWVDWLFVPRIEENSNGSWRSVWMGGSGSFEVKWHPRRTWSDIRIKFLVCQGFQGKDSRDHGITWKEEIVFA